MARKSTMLTRDVQMLQVGAARHHLEYGLVGHVVAASHLQAPELRAARGHRVEPPVGEPAAAAHHHRLQGQADVGRVLAEASRQHPQSAVDVQHVARQLNGPPEPRVPGQVVPAAAHAGAAAQLVGGQVREDLQEGVVRQDVDGRLLLVAQVPRAPVPAGEAGGRGVHHGNGLRGEGGGGGGGAVEQHARGER